MDKYETQIIVRLPEWLKDGLAEMASRRGKATGEPPSMSAVVRSALVELLEREGLR